MVPSEKNAKKNDVRKISKCSRTFFFTCLGSILFATDIKQEEKQRQIANFFPEFLITRCNLNASNILKIASKAKVKKACKINAVLHKDQS